MSKSTLAYYPIGSYWMTRNTKSITTATANTLVSLGQVTVTDKYLKELLSILFVLDDQTDCGLGVLNGNQPLETAQKQTSHDADMQGALTYLNNVFVNSQSFLQGVTRWFSNIGKKDENAMEYLKNVKEHLLKFTGLLDKIFLFYSNMNSVVRIQPSLAEVKESAEELKNVMDLKKLSELLSNVKATEEEILCTIVGLQNSVAQRLASLNSDVRDHQTDMYFLKRFISDNCENPEVGGPLTEEQAVVSKLQEMGFTESRSQVVADWIAKQPVPGHRSLLSWVERYVENIFKYDIFLNEYVSSYPYEDSKVNEWFDVSVQVYGKNVETVNVFNTTCDQASEAINQKVQKYKSTKVQECWLHGTDHKAAVNIVDNGIVFGDGGINLDFSQHDGFYLYPDGQGAVEWVKTVKTGAVIMFKALEENRFNCLDLESDTQHWKQVVKWNRSGENREESLDGDLEEQYKTCDYIRGPMANNGAKYTGTSWEPQPITHRQQICVKSKQMAAAIGKLENILGVVYWNSL